MKDFEINIENIKSKLTDKNSKDFALKTIDYLERLYFDFLSEEQMFQKEKMDKNSPFNENHCQEMILIKNSMTQLIERIVYRIENFKI